MESIWLLNRPICQFQVNRHETLSLTPGKLTNLSLLWHFSTLIVLVIHIIRLKVWSSSYSSRSTISDGTRLVRSRMELLWMPQVTLFRMNQQVSGTAGITWAHYQRRFLQVQRQDQLVVWAKGNGLLSMWVMYCEKIWRNQQVQRLSGPATEGRFKTGYPIFQM